LERNKLVSLTSSHKQETNERRKKMISQNASTEETSKIRNSSRERSSGMIFFGGLVGTYYWAVLGSFSGAGSFLVADFEPLMRERTSRRKLVRRWGRMS